MAMTYSPLPSDKADLVFAINESRATSIREKNISLVDWYISHYYLLGVRQFSVWNWMEGDVQIAYEGFDDELRFRWEHIVTQYLTELGRYMKMDLSPESSAFGFGLDSIRKAGVGNATLKYCTSHLNMKRLQAQFCMNLLKFGTVGLGHSRCAGRTVRERTCVEVIPPWELECIPGEMHNENDLQVVLRVRRVPYEWVKTLDGLSLPRGKNVSHLGLEEYPYGISPVSRGLIESSVDRGAAFTGNQQIYETPPREQGSSARKRLWVEMTEAYAIGPYEDTTIHYVVKIGDHIAVNQQFDPEQRVICPISIARHTATGRFYGRSWLGPKIGLNDQVEHMLRRLFQNVSDLDEYGILVVPSNAGVSSNELKKRERRKVIMSTPNPIAPNFNPYVLQPANSGDAPAKVANLGVQLQDKDTAQGPLFSGQAPGRIDSASALGLTYETGNTSLIPPSHQIADCWRGFYKSVLQAVREESQGLRDSDPTGLLTLPFLDDTMLGVIMDPKTGSLDLSKNPVPHPWDISLDVRDRLPTSKQQMIQEAKEAYAAGLMTDIEYEILNFRESLGLPIVNRSRWEAYRRAVYQSLLLFNDGENPGESLFHNFTSDQPEVTLMVLTQMMTGIQFQVASEPVRTQFENWKIAVELGTGNGFPGQIPYPEEAAQLEQQGPQAQMTAA